MRTVFCIALASVLLSCTPTQPPLTMDPFRQGLGSTHLSIGHPDDRAYLGITHPREHCTLEEIETEILIVEILSMYCPLCQKDAPKTNELHSRLDKKGFSDRVKIIGIAINNTPFEATLFKKKYAIPFPIIPDPDARNAHALGSRGTPHFLILKKDADRYAILYSKQERLTNVSSFLSFIEDHL